MDKIYEISEGVATDPHAIQVARKETPGIDIPWSVYFIGGIVAVVVLLIGTQQVSKKDDAAGKSKSGPSSFGGFSSKK